MKTRTNRSKIDVSPPVAPVEVALLEKLFDLSPDVAFFLKDAVGRYVAVNESLVVRHGLRNKSQVIGKCPRDICPGDFGRIPTEQDEKVLRTGRPLVDTLRDSYAQQLTLNVYLIPTNRPAPAGLTIPSPDFARPGWLDAD